MKTIHTLRDAVREEIRTISDGPDPDKVIFHTTHTHAGPEIGFDVLLEFLGRSYGVDLDVRPAGGYFQFVIGQLIAAIREAWDSRKPGSMEYGLDCAVIARNRRRVDAEGRALMYGLDQNTSERFHHFEGYEDHSLNLLATYHPDGGLSNWRRNIRKSGRRSPLKSIS